MPLPHYPDTGGPSLGQTASRVGSSWLDNLWNSFLGLIGMTMQDPTGDPRTQQQLNAMAQNAQQQLGSPMAQNGFYQPGSQEDVVGTGLFLLTPVPFLKGKPCPEKPTFFHYTTNPNLEGKGLRVGSGVTSVGDFNAQQAMLNLGVTPPQYVYPVTLDKPIDFLSIDLGTPARNTIPSWRVEVPTPPGSIGPARPVPPGN
jgi:hypothetical protein